MAFPYWIAAGLSLASRSYAVRLSFHARHESEDSTPSFSQIDPDGPEQGASTSILVPLVAGTVAFTGALLLCAKKKKDESPGPARAISENPNIVYEDVPKPHNAPADNHVSSDTKEKSAASSRNVSPTKSSQNVEKEDYAGFSAVSDGDDTLPRPPPKPKPKDDLVVSVTSVKKNSGYVGFGDVQAALGKGDVEDETSFGGFESTMSTNTSIGEEVHEAEVDDDAIPAWYAGKISRDICEEVVLAASTGDFLVRESSKGDRCVICINSHGTALNLMVVVRNNKYRFAGKDRDSLHDVIFFLRKRPITSGSATPFKLAKAAPGMREGLEKDRRRSRGLSPGAEVQQETEQERKLHFTRRTTDNRASWGSTDVDAMVYSPSEVVFSPDAMELYDDPRQAIPEGSNDTVVEDEPLYVDMHDANVPSWEWIARAEEEERMREAGRATRMSNAEFGRLREEARQRAYIAATENRKAIQAMRTRASVRRAWSKGQQPNALPAPPQAPALSSIHDTDEENFFDYQNASMREFGTSFEEEDIYDTVPAWFAGRLERKKCEAAVQAGTNGTYLVRESSSGDKYIICVKYNDIVKNFQIHITDDGAYRFSGRIYSDLEGVMTHVKKHGISKDKAKIPLAIVAPW
eukprot:m.555067 g.555067  ORF g.555067 m.555067 type:complete len:634 (+) comp22180_c0_seq3:280-2181(+)